jgi:3-oxoacyl-[acyl-carrier protein] reductase
MSDGRVAFITGGSRGIGLAIARRLQRDGYRVAVTWRTECPDEETLGGLEGAVPIHPICCDVRDPESIEAAFTEVETHFGAVEILVCSAGITDDTLLLLMSEEKWARVLDTNLTAAFRTSKRAASKMVRARFGRIILISSVVGYLGSPGQANYAASKAALVGFGRSLARELASRNITVNIVAPGVITTDMTAVLSPDRLAALTSMVPLGRPGEPEEVATAVAWLAADTSAYVTGAVIPVDGGLGMGH